MPDTTIALLPVAVAQHLRLADRRLAVPIHPTSPEPKPLIEVRGFALMAPPTTAGAPADDDVVGYGAFTTPAEDAAHPTAMAVYNGVLLGFAWVPLFGQAATTAATAGLALQEARERRTAGKNNR